MKSLLIIFAFLPYVLVAQPSEYIRRTCEQLSAQIPVIAKGERLYCQSRIPEFYQQRSFELAWNNEDRQSLFHTISNATKEGLTPNDYHYQAIKEAMEVAATEELDVLLTDAYLLYASHLLNGKVNPETVDSEWKAIRREGNPVNHLIEALNTHDIEGSLLRLIPSHPSYAKLKSQLEKYRSYEYDGGWAQIEDGPTLKIGMSDPRVAKIKERLQHSGEYRIENSSADYDSALASAITTFQFRNGLETDGNVGKQTLAALNISAEDRINQVLINMERYRWISQDLGSHYVLVNIADYKMQVYKDANLTYEEKVIVGKPFRKTPVFSGKMTYMVLNPYWTIPPTILFNDILPEVKKNVNYLAGKHMKVLKGTTVIDPTTVNWSKLSQSNFPYIIRQDPGKTNALGAVKFMFPNSYNVYIHDTPSKELFARPDRAFSSGCIRLNKPLNFVKYLIKNDSRYSSEYVHKILAGSKEETLFLKEPLKVHIIYLTAWVENDILQFRNDLYDRDKPVIEALRSEAPGL